MEWTAEIQYFSNETITETIHGTPDFVLEGINGDGQFAKIGNTIVPKHSIERITFTKEDK